MNYKETVEWLFSQLPNYQLQGASAYKPGLHNIEQLLKLTGNPEKGLRFFHVAGTNGKGSVSNMLASVMQEHGFKTGLFTSPHLHDFRERIRVNGQMADPDFVVDFVSRYQEGWKEINPSFFEITTAMAFAYFKKQACDVCILETGLGGRLDSTNVITPEISIITNIGMDHTAFLGNTLEKIAFEKAGIIKENVPVIIGEWNEKTQPVFEEAARSKNAALTLSDARLAIATDLKGSFQQKNVATVMTALHVLKKSGWKFEDSAIQAGLLSVNKNTQFKGRFQQIGEKPLVFADGAHNEDGVKIFLHEISKLPGKKLHLIYGAASDKDVKNIFPLFPKNALYYFTEFNSMRTQKLDFLKEMAAQNNLQAKFFTHPHEAFNAAKQYASEEDLIGIYGSFYLIQEFI